MTLDSVDMCIRAATTAHLSGREVELFGLKDEAMNGCRGVVGGYLTHNDRRAVYLFTKGNEVAINPINLRPVATIHSTHQELPMLADIPDRMGAVSLAEVIMADRTDVAEFLLMKHHASIDVEDMDGVTPRKMSMSPSQVMNQVCAMVHKEARTRSKNETKEDKLHCSYCRTRAEDLLLCLKCQSVRYCNAECQKKHWDESHKSVCKKLCGIKLDPPSDTGMHTMLISMKSNHSSSDGSYRKPDDVDFNERFNIKVQSCADVTPIMIYDKSRQCFFELSPDQPGFNEVLQATRSQVAYGGRKCFMKASFDEKGRCTVYPGTANVKHGW